MRHSARASFILSWIHEFPKGRKLIGRKLLRESQNEFRDYVQKVCGKAGRRHSDLLNQATELLTAIRGKEGLKSWEADMEDTFSKKAASDIKLRIQHHLSIKRIDPDQVDGMLEINNSGGGINRRVTRTSGRVGLRSKI